MLSFKDFLNEATQPMSCTVSSDAIKKPTEETGGSFLKIGLSGSTATFSTPDGRHIKLTDATDIISAAGLKDGSFAYCGGIPKFSGETPVKYTKSQKSIDLLGVKVGMANASIEIDGNRQFKDMIEGGWYAFCGGRPGMGKYKIKDVMGPHAGMPSPSEEISFTDKDGKPETGVVLKINGASKVMDVKTTAGKKVQVSMYVE